VSDLDVEPVSPDAPPLRGPKLDRVDKDQFMNGGRAMPVAQYFARDSRPICQVDAPW